MYLKGLINESQSKAIDIEDNQLYDIYDLKEYIINTYEGYRNADFILVNNGRIRHDQDVLSSEMETYEVRLLMLGGKGGFGSLLKGQPPVKKRTNNFDSCRDLSGRRIRHVNQEKMLHDWQLKKNEEERMVKEFENPEEEKNIKNYIDHNNKQDVIELNKKFKIESEMSVNSVAKSIKYLMKKKKRQEIVEISQIDKNGNVIAKLGDKQIETKLNANKNNLNNIDESVIMTKKTGNKKPRFQNEIIIDDILVDDKNIDKETLERELFAFD